MNAPKLSCLVIAVLLTGVSLNACRTTSGLGEDISATGDAIEREADKATPK